MEELIENEFYENEEISSMKIKEKKIFLWLLSMEN